RRRRGSTAGEGSTRLQTSPPRVSRAPEWRTLLQRGAHGATGSGDVGLIPLVISVEAAGVRGTSTSEDHIRLAGTRMLLAQEPS
ncbi:unnamed protein product, partial [Urochloa humidicola]